MVMLMVVVVVVVMMGVVVMLLMGVVMVMVKKVGSGRGTAAAILADPNLSQDQVQSHLSQDQVRSQHCTHSQPPVAQGACESNNISGDIRI